MIHTSTNTADATTMMKIVAMKVTVIPITTPEDDVVLGTERERANEVHNNKLNQIISIHQKLLDINHA